MKSQARVLAVLEGTWGLVTQAEAASLVRTIMESLQSHGRQHEVEVTVDFAETLAEVPTLLAQTRYGLVVFNSRGILDQARAIKAKFPRTKMALMTGVIPREELVIVNKAWLGCDRNPLFDLLTSI